MARRAARTRALARAAGVAAPPDPHPDPPGHRAAVPVRDVERRQRGRRRQRVHLRAARARSQHRGGLRGPARPGLCGLLRDRRLRLRRRCVRASQARVVEPVDSARVGGTGEPTGGARPARHRAVPLRLLADAGRHRHRLRDFRPAVRRPNAPAAGRLPGDRDPGLRRDRAGGRPQLGRADQRGAGAGRHPHAPALRCRVRFLAVSLLLPRPGAGRRRRLDLHPAAGVTARPRLDGHPGGRVGGGGHGCQSRPLQADGLRHGRRGGRARRHVLRGQADHGHAGHVHVPGVGHDSGHGGVGRSRVDPRRGGGRAVPVVSPIRDPAGAH